MNPPRESLGSSKEVNNGQNKNSDLSNNGKSHLKTSENSTGETDGDETDGDGHARANEAGKPGGTRNRSKISKLELLNCQKPKI